MIGSWGALLRRGAGIVLIAAIIAPWWRLADPAASDVLVDMMRRSDRLLTSMWLETGVILLVGAGVALFGRRLDRVVSALGAALRRPSARTYAVAVGLLAAGHVAAVSLIGWEGRPPLTDAWAQIIQGRYLAAGQLAAGPDVLDAFFIVANTFVTDAGWTAQYPPGHPALLAVGIAAGVPWIIGPVLVGGTAALISLLGERLFASDPIISRLAALIAALSPLLSLVGAAYMSHAPAAFLTVLAAYAAARAGAGPIAWVVLAGAAVGAAFLVRPLTGVTVGLVASAGAWLIARADGHRRGLAARWHAAAALIGGIPLVIFGLWYNATLFGSPFEFGYTAYLGPGHAPGWHPNPWGHPYGLREAVAFTTADLTALGHYLLRAPISGVFLVGVFLAAANRLTAPARLVTIWAAIGVADVAAYWHHDLLLGPRMLADAGPAWCLLVAVAGISLARRLPATNPSFRGLNPRRAGTAALVGAAAYGFVVGPARTIREVDRAFPPPPEAPESPGPTLVFVHDTWSGRLAARLGASRMRADSITALLETTDRCVIQGVLDGVLDRSALRFDSGDGAATTELPQSLRTICTREDRADRFGGLPLMPLIWQGDLPGLTGRGAMFVRDLGPRTNADLLARHPDRRPAMLLLRPPGPRPAIVPYDTGIALLWNPAGSVARDSASAR